MKALTPYLMFDGNTRDAMNFYKKCLGGELFIMTYAEMPPSPGCEVAPETKDRIMHAGLAFGGNMLMASDTMPGMPFTAGNNFMINIPCESDEEADRLFNALGDGGKVTMALCETFWAQRFGMLVDKFGTHWMFNHERPQMG